jgi:Transposase
VTDGQQDWLDELLQQPLDIARACERALKFDHFYELEADAAEEYLRRWIDETRATELQPLIESCDTLEAHWQGVIRWHHPQRQQRVSFTLHLLVWWCGCGGDVLGDAFGVMMTGGGDPGAPGGLGALASVGGSVLAGVVEVGAAAVDPPAVICPRCCQRLTVPVVTRSCSAISSSVSIPWARSRCWWEGMPRRRHSWVSEVTVNGLPQPPVTPWLLRISTV